MIRTGFTLAVWVGLALPIAADESNWSSGEQPKPLPPQVVAPTTPDVTWKSGAKADPNWKPSVKVSPAQPLVLTAAPPPNHFPTTLPQIAPIAPPPIVVFETIGQAEQLPLPRPAGKPAEKPAEKPSAPKPSAPKLPDLPMPPPAPPAPITPLPTPRDVPAALAPNKPAVTPSPAKPDPIHPAPAVAEGVVWGSYVPAGQPVPKKPSVRHNAFGSPNLRLSRDYHFLDAFTQPLIADDEQAILPDPIRGPRSYVQAEYLMWFVNRPNIPVLASTAQAQMFGFLGTPGTQVLLGPGGFGGTRRDGFRVRAGTWLDECQTCGLDASYFHTGRQADSRTFSFRQFPTIARPFFAPNLNREFAELVSFPGLSTGTLNVRQSSELWGADVNARKAIYTCGCDRRLEAFLGYRHLNLKEDLAITEYLIAGPTAPDPVGTTIVVQDRFATTNRFHGGQIGLSGYQAFGKWNVSGRASVAFGNTRQIIDIFGSQVRTRPGLPADTFTGGLLAAGPNIGRFTRDRFSVVPEVTLNVGYNVTPNLNLYLGYNFLGWTNVVRPGDQIDRTVDLTFVPNSPSVPFSTNRPLPTFRQSDVWVNGIQIGAELRW